MRRSPSRALQTAMGAGLLVGFVVVLVINLGRGNELWDYSDGVYLLTARLFLHGGDLYGHLVAAQPPGVFTAGAGILALHDGLGWVRVCVGLVQLAGGGLAGLVVWRLTHSAVGAACAPVLAVLLPWAVHQHGAMTPEPFGALCLLACLLAVGTGRPAVAAGLAALAVGFKLPYALPALAVLASSERRREALAWFAWFLVAGAALGTLLFGTGLWRDIVVAQLHLGTNPLRGIAQMLAQAVWNVAGLLAPALLGVLLGRRSRDAALWRGAVALAAGWLLTLLSTSKNGTGLNILVPIEVSLLPLALAGAVWAWRAPRSSSWRSRAPVLIAGLGIAFVLAQTASLLHAPRHTAFPFTYPTSARGAWAQTLSAARIDRQVRSLAHCRPGLPYGGQPLVAYLTHRSIQDGQADGFLTFAARDFRAVAQRMRATQVCPYAAP